MMKVRLTKDAIDAIYLALGGAAHDLERQGDEDTSRRLNDLAAVLAETAEITVEVSSGARCVTARSTLETAAWIGTEVSR